MRTSRLFIIMVGLCLTACATVSPLRGPASKPDYRVAYFPDLPADAQRVAERMAACRYWRGEIMGDDTPRQAEVNAALRQLHCNRIDQDEAMMRAKYAGNDTIQHALDKAAHWFANQASIAAAWS